MDGELIIMNDPRTGIPFLGWVWHDEMGQSYYLSLFHFNSDAEWNYNLERFNINLRTVAQIWDNLQKQIKESQSTPIPDVFRRAFEIPP